MGDAEARTAIFARVVGRVPALLWQTQEAMQATPDKKRGEMGSQALQNATWQSMQSMDGFCRVKHICRRQTASSIAILTINKRQAHLYPETDRRTREAGATEWDVPHKDNFGLSICHCELRVTIRTHKRQPSLRPVAETADHFWESGQVGRD